MNSPCTSLSCYVLHPVSCQALPPRGTRTRKRSRPHTGPSPHTSAPVVTVDAYPSCRSRQLKVPTPGREPTQKDDFKE